jgi:DNA-binding NarL/FixJ family response regulator
LLLFVVILTKFSQDEELFAALKAGARGYILKDASAAVIVEAVRDAYHGRASLSHELETRVIDHLAELEQRAVDPDALTVREVEILGYMRQGMSYKEIGAQLNITAKTVNYHVTHILHKLHVRSRGEAVAQALERGLLSLVVRSSLSAEVEALHCGSVQLGLSNWSKKSR